MISISQRLLARNWNVIYGHYLKRITIRESLEKISIRAAINLFAQQAMFGRKLINLSHVISVQFVELQLQKKKEIKQTPKWKED